MQLQVTINGATLTALLDSGFMHNFLDADVAARVGITFHDRPGCELLLSKWFHNTSSDTVIRAARKGSLIRGTKTLDAQGVSYDENDGLRGSGHRSVIPYINGRMGVVVLLCVVLI
jgi:hypothetical protein